MGKSIGDNKQVLSTLEKKANFKGSPLRYIIFSQGADATPWANAIAAVKIGSLLAIPWIFVFIREFRVRRIESLYPLLSIADIFLYGILVWFMIAFVFGYFYHMLKGRNGIEKGFWLSLLIIISRASPAILFADDIQQASRLLTWSVQVFIYCMLLGFFAFDYRILKKSGYGWREVGLIYNLAYLSTFGSGLLAALLGVLSGQLQELFKSILSTLFNP